MKISTRLFSWRKPRPLRHWRVIGPFHGVTGTDRLVRSLVPCLRALSVTVDLVNLPQWSPVRREEPLPRGLSSSRRRPADLQVHFGMPLQVAAFPDCPTINYTMFEADRIPSSWAQAASRVELIIVPTESSRRSWMAGGVPGDKIAICPEGVDFQLFSPAAPPLDLRTSVGRAISGYRYRFLNVAEWITRKNGEGLLRTWLRNTSSSDDAVLVLKLGFYTSSSRRSYEDTLGRIEMEVGKRFTQAAPMMLCEKQLSEAEMSRLYTAANHYWSMSFGEGFDLPMMEAVACGLQLIAPAHSSYLDYLKPDYAHLLSIHEVEAMIPDDLGLASFFQGSNWWRPDEDEAGKILRGIIDGRISSLPPARARLIESWSWSRMAQQLVQVVDMNRARLEDTLK